jgi:hypothetical protein
MLLWLSYVVRPLADATKPDSFADWNVVNYLLIKHDNKSAAIPILVIYFLLFILMTVSFLRLVHITVYDPPYVPLGPAALRDRKGYREKSEGKIWSEENGIGTGEYDPRNNSGGTSPDIPGCNNDPDSPGLELFYTKNIFVCEMDGRPIWCSQCSNWCALFDLCSQTSEKLSGTLRSKMLISKQETRSYSSR